MMRLAGSCPRLRPVIVAPPSGRKREVLELIAAGYATKQIAARLGVSSPTIEKHLRQMFRRYGVPVHKTA